VPGKKINWEKAYDVVEPGINAEGVHVYPFDSTLPLDVGFFVHAGRHNVRMNRHDYLEVIYVYGGETEIQIRERYFRVKKGDLVVVGPHIYHRIVNRPNVQVKLASLNFQPEVVRGGNTGGDEEQYFIPFLAQAADFPHVVPPSTGIPDEILGLMHRIHDELPATSVLSRLAVKTFMRMILIILAKHYAAYLGTRGVFGRKQKAIQRLNPVFEYLEKCYGETIHVEDAARLCAMSPSHFMGFFKQVTGQSFVAYLNCFRIAKAQTFLACTDKAISEISIDTGFCAQSYFGKVFHKLVGMTPLSYRRRIGEVKPSPASSLPEKATEEVGKRSGLIRASRPKLQRVFRPLLPPGKVLEPSLARAH
jgi:AraC-like DNA-binding protein/mannose-6-phosphate isomerase-like protein (cupin superfamily)